MKLRYFTLRSIDWNIMLSSLSAQAEMVFHPRALGVKTKQETINQNFLEVYLSTASKLCGLTDSFHPVDQMQQHFEN